jgi:hypothetical protein
MTEWLTSLALILTLGASVLAGTPLHGDDQVCPMTGMSGAADCCASAREQGGGPGIASARLCCALNCPQSGTTTPAGTQLTRVSTALAVAFYPATVQPPASAQPPTHHSNWAHSPPQSSNPAYIRHLALLI